jgi:hypothetical protein
MLPGDLAAFVIERERASQPLQRGLRILFAERH